MSMSSKAEGLAGVYWIGGGSGGGKSTIARRIASEHGMRVYSTDDAMADHARRTTPEEAPYLADFIAMDQDERWVNRSAETMLATFHWYRGEGFGLIVEDLLELPGPVIAEGFRLLPHLVAPYLTDPRHAVWLLPTPAFRSAAFTARGGTWDIAGRTSHPDRALANLLERDRMFTERLATETRRLGMRAIAVAPGRTEDELVELVTRSFGL